MTARDSMRPGAIVKLLSGSPDMTVLHVEGESVFVAWCGDDDSGIMHQAELPAVALRPVAGKEVPAPSYTQAPFHVGREPPFRPDFDDGEIPF